MIWLLLYCIYPFLNLNYSELNLVKALIDKGKFWKLLICFFFSLCETVVKLVTKCAIKCYCSITASAQNFYLFTDFFFFFFGVILCLRVFFLCNQLHKIVFLQHMRYVVASYTGKQVLTVGSKQVLGINCKQHQAVLWWQNNFGITLSQLLQHMYHVMQICLPNKHNVTNHFCL